MRRHRFIGNFNLEIPRLIVDDIGLINQWHNVLRLSPGEELILGDGVGQEAVAKIVSLDRKRAELEVGARRAGTGVPAREVTLFLSILKRDNFELAVAKAVECGVTRIVPMITSRTVKLGLSQERLERIICESAEQSGRSVLPTVGDVLDFDQAFREAGVSGKVILFDGSGETLSANHLSGKCSIFIGPEGGFSEEEVGVARGGGADIVSLGSLTLRAETAAMVATYLTAQFLNNSEN